ncbi:WxL domain-containing protein [Carnobacterium maltaromaticum]|uniref:WxL domain-containing protein n=1 Tax=Carnobacterium maltaromaticum TaxID=2751 RepID=UPI0015E10DD4|nr:WxL domain-containing protein [Carnobacterium maltaromaticum]
MYDQDKGGISANQMSSFFSENILNFGYSGFGGVYPFYGVIEPNTKFHTSFRGNIYYGISQYGVTDTHELSPAINTANALGDTTYSNMGNQLNKISVMEGTIYKVFSAEPDKIRLWENGIPRQIKNTSKKENYVELTKNQGLVELDFNNVTSKAVTVELGSKPENLKVEDFTNVTDYPNLSSSFKTAVRTDKLGTYNQEISIRQNLITASNYIVSTVSSKVTVVDTTPPMATNKENVKIPIYGSLPTDPAELLDNLKDNSGVENLKLEYLDETGDTSVPGLKKVKIRITDVSGNFTDVTVNLTIVPGSLTIKNVPNMDFGKIKIGESSKNVSQNDELDVVMSVDDLRGNGAGWTLQASISNFTTKDGKELNAQISLLNGVVSNVDNSVEGLNAFDISLNNHFQTIMQAKQGSGVKNSTVTFKNEDVSLGNISSDARIGLYEATINWVLLDTP